MILLLLVLGAAAVLPGPGHSISPAAAGAHAGAAAIAISLVFDVMDFAAYLLLVPRPRRAAAYVGEGMLATPSPIPPGPLGAAGTAGAPGRGERLLRLHVVIAFAAAPILFGIWIAGVPDLRHVGIWWRIALVLGWAAVPFFAGMRAQPPGRPGVSRRQTAASS